MAESKPQCIFRESTDKRLVEIYDHNGYRSLYFGGRHLQSRMSIEEPHTLLLPYTWYMMLSLLLLEAPKRVLLIGLGAGSLVRFIHHFFPKCVIDAVDSSEQVIKLAKGYFQFPDTSHVQAHWCDGRAFLQDLPASSRYDLILFDAYDESGIVSTIYDTEPLNRAAQALAPQGIVASNLWSGGPRSAREIDSLLAPSLPGNLFLPVPERGNIVSLRSHQQPDWSRLSRTWQDLHTLSQRYGLNFYKMVRVAMRSNLSIEERLRLAVSFAEESVFSALKRQPG